MQTPSQCFFFLDLDKGVLQLHINFSLKMPRALLGSGKQIVFILRRFFSPTNVFCRSLTQRGGKQKTLRRRGGLRPGSVECKPGYLSYLDRVFKTDCVVCLWFWIKLPDRIDSIAPRGHSRRAASGILLENCPRSATGRNLTAQLSVVP